jgi:hypothetical protein
MKLLMRYAVLCVVFVLVNAAFGRTPRPSFSLTVSLPHSVVKSGSDMEVDVTMTNISHKDIEVSKVVGTAEANYEIEVTDSEGKPAAPTRYERMLRGEPPATDHHSVIISSLKPGQTMQEFFYANQLFDMDKPGKYTIQVSTTVYVGKTAVKDATKVLVKANIVKLTVTD